MIARIGKGSRALPSALTEGESYATDPENGLVHFISTRPWLQEVGAAYIGKTVKSLALSADGKKLYVADIGGPIPNGKIHVFETGN